MIAPSWVMRLAPALAFTTTLAAIAIMGMSGCPVATLGTAAIAAGRDFGAVARYVFVPSRDKPVISIIEIDSDRLVGSLNPGLIPTQTVVSEAAAKLVAADGMTHAVSVTSMENGQTSTIELDFAPSRLVGGADGYLVVAADLSGGTVAFVDLVRQRVASRVAGLGTIRDLMLGPDSAFLYVASDGLTGIGVVDVARGKLIDQIPTSGAGGKISGLTRSPSGRLGYAKAQDGGSISVFDLANFRPLQRIEVGPAATKAFPTGFGGYLLVPDNVERTVTLVATSSMTVAAMLKGSANMTTVHSGWLDTVALVPSSTERKLLVYDLDRLVQTNEIALPGVPGPGAVTSEGTKLYIPLEGTSQVAVVDLKTRQLARTIDVGFEPAAAIMARSFDICH